MSANGTYSADSIIDMTGSMMAEKIRAGELSSREIVEAHIRRIEATDKSLNAVVIKLFDQARAKATAADEAAKRGEWMGPLHGVPMTIKEQFDVEGAQTCVGVPSQTGIIAKRDGPLVARLRSSGAIILGKTNVPMSLFAWDAENPVYGVTKNPWNLNRTPGGSSGGEGAIIAARGSPMGMGGDFGGSIRIPSHYSGVHGFKPTSRRLTNTDSPARLFSSGQNVIYAQPGPMARSVADLKLMMQVMADPPMERTADFIPPVPWPDPDKVSINGLTVGMFTYNGMFFASPAIRRAVEESADALRERGAIVKPFTPPDLVEAILLYMMVVTAGGDEGIPRTLKGTPPSKLIEPIIKGVQLPGFIRWFVARGLEKKGDDITAQIVRVAKVISSEEYWKLVERVHQYRERFLQALDREQIDALICPPSTTIAPHLGSSGELGVAPGTYVVPFNTLGTPAGVVSVTRVQKGEEIEEKRRNDKNPAELAALKEEAGSAGLPVGVQVVGRPWRDDVVLKVMEALEDHFKTRPDYPPGQRPLI
jgi:fatty acid amide hydrolase